MLGLAVALSACAPDAIPIVTPYVADAPAPTSTATASPPTITSTPGPVYADPTRHNGLTLPADLHSATWQYYEDSPAEFWGYATRYGSEERAASELIWYSHELIAQQDAGHVIIGGEQGAGGYGYFDRNGNELLLDGLDGLPYAVARMVWGVDGWSDFNDEQQRLRTIVGNEGDWFSNSRIVGTVSIKSPNDIGRLFCLYRVDHDSLLATSLGIVMVGGTAARTDWSIYGPSVNDDYDHQRLGGRVLVDNQLREWHWAADLPDQLYEAALDGDSALIGLIEYNGGDCGP